jgi:hypothetical protein
VTTSASAKRVYRPLDPEQRRQLSGLTLVLTGSLLILLGLSLRAGSNWPDLPALIPPLNVSPNAAGATPSATPTPAPTRSIFWWFSGTPQLGEEGVTRTPAAPARDQWDYYAPLVLYNYGVPGLPPATQVPEPPKAEPTPNWPDGLSHLTNSKLGVHVIANNDPYIMEFIRRARPRVVKSVDDLGWLADVKRVSPNTLTIGRLNTDQDEGALLSKDPVVAADDYIAAQLERYRLNPGVDVWEGPNEFVPVDAARMQWFARFEARRACRMQELGLRAAVGGFSVGVPEYDQMDDFLPALEAAYRCNGIFTLHEYNSPDMRCLTDTGRAGIIPGAPQLSDTLYGPLTLRYRFWYEGYLKPRGMGSLPLVISELGLANILTIADCNDPGGDGWKAYNQYWIDHGVGADGPQAYVNVLAWYDQEMRKDSYVLGATIFTAGARLGGGWFSMDIHDMLNPLAWYAVEQ